MTYFWYASMMKASSSPNRVPTWALDIQRQADAARSTWAGQFEVPEEVFCGYLQARRGAISSVDTLYAADLYLACACERGDPDAIAILLQGIDAHVLHPLRRRYNDPAQLDDLRQNLVTLLLYGGRSEGARINRYEGRGRIWAWLRVIAGREARDLVAKVAREVPSEDSLLDAAVGGGEPDLGWLKETYRAAFRRAFCAALQALSAADRVLLKQHYLDGLSIDRLAALYRTHRATTARRLQRLREDLFINTQQRMERDLQIPTAEFASVMQLLQSQLDASIERFLKHPSNKKGHIFQIVE